MRRGEIWWAELPKPAGTRPIVILSRDKAVQIREYVTVAEITRTIRNIPTEVSLGLTDGLPKTCVINLDVINTIPKHLLSRYISSLNRSKMQELESALKFALGIL